MRTELVFGICLTFSAILFIIMCWMISYERDKRRENERRIEKDIKELKTENARLKDKLNVIEGDVDIIKVLNGDKM